MGDWVFLIGSGTGGEGVFDRLRHELNWVIFYGVCVHGERRGGYG